MGQLQSRAVLLKQRERLLLGFGTAPEEPVHAPGKLWRPSGSRPQLSGEAVSLAPWTMLVVRLFPGTKSNPRVKVWAGRAGCAATPLKHRGELIVLL